MHSDLPFPRLAAFLNSPANWSGLAVATLVLLASAFGPWLPGGWPLVPLGYALGFGGAGLLFGFPFRRALGWSALEVAGGHAGDDTMRQAVARMRALLEANPGARLAVGLQTRALQLCEQLEALADQLEGRQGVLSTEEAFHARRIAEAYLPEALRTYLAIEPHAARSLRLAHGLTAEATLSNTLDELSGKARQLQEALTLDDAEAFLSHARFLQDKFGARNPPSRGQ